MFILTYFSAQLLCSTSNKIPFYIYITDSSIVLVQFKVA